MRATARPRALADSAKEAVAKPEEVQDDSQLTNMSRLAREKFPTSKYHSTV